MTISSTSLVVPITSSAASAQLGPPYLVHASARDLQLSWDGWIHADQIFTFPAAKLDERLGVLAGRKLEELDRALRFVLGLDT
jgi:mRNA-degrading endonuclease toxin of MazEF toxin-antitoxin module